METNLNPCDADTEIFMSKLDSTNAADIHGSPDSKVHGANMEPTWVLSAPSGPHVGPMNLAVRLLSWSSPQ